MPKLKTHATPVQVREMSPEEREAFNDARPPSDQAPTVFCPAKVRTGERRGEPCSNSPGAGTNHPGFGYCSKHGGNTPAGVKAAARQMGRQIVREMKWGGDRHDLDIMNITAEEALLEEVRRSSAMVRFLEEKIGQWQDSELDEAPGLGLPRLVEETSKGAPGATDAQAWLVVYREERKHLAQVSKMCIDAKISHRLVDLAQMQGQVIKNIIKFALEQLNLTEIQIQAVPTVVSAAIARGQREINRSGMRDDAYDIVSVPGDEKKITRG